MPSANSEKRSTNSASSQAKFLQGSLMRHVVTMTLSASLGLFAIFLVDFADLYFISLLGQQELSAAVGFAGSLLFFTTSISIGLSIAMSALAGRKIGAGEPEQAKRLAMSVLSIGVVFSCFVVALVYWQLPNLLTLMGATGRTRSLAIEYLQIVVLSMPILVIGMSTSGLLRAYGDAKGSMFVTLSAGAVNALLDPLLIFGFGLELTGAALATIGARFAMMFVALRLVYRKYNGLAPLKVAHILADAKPVLGIAAPAILTNIATPIGNFLTIRAIAPFGDSAMAGYAVVGRLIPLCFCLIFALSGAVGPILAQNFGAKKYERLQGTLVNAMLFMGGYLLLVWITLFFTHQIISDVFQLNAEARLVVTTFALAVTPLFFSNGVVFLANASFNNLNRPIWSTWLNWGRQTLGVAPFVWIGGTFYNVQGVLIGQALGGVIFAIIGVFLTLRLVRRYAAEGAEPDPSKSPVMRPRPTPAFSSPRG